MKRRITTLRVGEDGSLPSLRVIGHAGRLGPRQTPARRGAVLADAENRVVDIIEVTAQGGRDSGSEVSFEVASRPVPQGELPGIGTRIGPWPARLRNDVVILGPRECRAADRIRRRALEIEAPERVRDFLRWFDRPETRSDLLTCERTGDLVAWYCSTDEAYILWKCIQPAALEELFEAARGGREDSIRDTAFWLSRAALTDHDIYLAVAGLKRAQYPHWESVLDAGVSANVAPADRLAGLERAEARLTKEASARGPGIHPAVARGHRRFIDEAFYGLGEVA